MLEKVKDKAKAAGTKAKNFVKGLPKKVLIAVAVLLVILLVAAAAVIASQGRDYEVLVTGVSNQEASAVLQFLQNRGVTTYKIENDDTILVPKSQEASLKAGLLMENIGQSGFFYSTYTSQVSALSTESERNNAFRMDLQERMGATVRCLDGVKDAVVTITPGEDRSYILDSNNIVNATASVLVVMQDGKEVTSELADGIRRLVGQAVQGLEFSEVEIVDQYGNPYPSFGELDGNDASTLKLELENLWANRIRTEVMQLLMPIFGDDNVRVGVNCTVEVSNVDEERMDYYLPDYAEDGSTDGRGIRDKESWQYYVERPGDGGVGGLVGSETNADLPENVEALADPDGTETGLGGSGQTDYANSYSHKNITDPSGKMTDCTIAVTINSRAVSTPPNLDEIRQLVARAAGIYGVRDEATNEEDLTGKISVVSMEFYDPTLGPADGGNDDGITIQPWMLIAAIAGLVLFIILLVVILLIRRKRRKKREEEERARLAEENAVDALLDAAGLNGESPEGVDVMDLQTERSMELRKDIRQFASDNPEIAAQMLKGWLRGGDDNG